ncbi:MAG: tRNA (adenosine(37)-N6)-threonylcarbamoyltransferase complex dimerization subunit type 1 TsaB [Nitrospiraceae bacterium]|nr:tRNA (adenosine(37)-N6)-threonylcarbamoyltransferase complex dimerization subunit type 1 TsaB [Nitrospiraceae bacterium]
MKCLAVETSTMLGGAAIVEDNRLVAELRINVRTTHSEGLMPAIDFLLHRAGLSIGDMDLFSVSAGPGSFTGLRVGLSTVKGLAFSTGKPIAAVSSLEALAWNLPFSAHQVCPLFDARRKEVYAGIYRWGAQGFEPAMPEKAQKIEDLLSAIDQPTVFIGEAADLCRDIIIGRLGSLALFAPPQKMSPSPANVGYLGIVSASRGELHEAADIMPRYLRKSEAEVKFDAGKV